MTNIKRHSIEAALEFWIRFVLKYPIHIVVMAVFAAIISLNYTINNLGMNTDTQDMLSSNLLWRQLDLEYQKEFPQYKYEKYYYDNAHMANIWYEIVFQPIMNFIIHNYNINH